MAPLPGLLHDGWVGMGEAAGGASAYENPGNQWKSRKFESIVTIEFEVKMVTQALILCFEFWCVLNFGELLSQ